MTEYVKFRQLIIEIVPIKNGATSVSLFAEGPYDPDRITSMGLWEGSLFCALLAALFLRPPREWRWSS